MGYDKKVKYLDYYESGQRVCGCGFVKLEFWDDRIKLKLVLRGIKGADGQKKEVMLCAGKREYAIGMISIVRGAGEFTYEGGPQWEGAQTQSGLPDGVCIHIGADREVSSRWQNPNRGFNAAGILTQEEIRAAEKKEQQRVFSSSDGGRQQHNEPRTAERAQETTQAERRSEVQTERWSEVQTERQSETQTERRPEIQTERRPEIQTERWSEIQAERRPEIQTERRSEARGESGAETRTKAPVRLLEDKWAQIYSIYPHVRPFQDEREYLSIGPADFLLFPAAAYRQVNNSFLLHGFYNYKHLILTRVERRGEIIYYVGVPGNFYEREKQVAVMFGFESFECAEEPAQDGDFGYYMMRTQL